VLDEQVTASDLLAWLSATRRRLPLTLFRVYIQVIGFTLIWAQQCIEFIKTFFCWKKNYRLTCWHVFPSLLATRLTFWKLWNKFMIQIKFWFRISSWKR
jgi:hypothetical protein